MAARRFNKGFNIIYLGNSDDAIGFADDVCAAAWGTYNRVERIPPGYSITFEDEFDSYRIYDEKGELKFVVIDEDFRYDLANGYYPDLLV